MTQPSNAKVSVIISTYNRAGSLPRAVNSVLAQTFTDFELIIVDDCSTDTTQEVIRKFADPRIHSVRHENNAGGSVARNTGIAYAKGEYVAFLDDDDEWFESKLARQARVLDESEPRVALVYTWFDLIEASSRKRRVGGRSAISGDIFEDMLGWAIPAPTSTYMVRAEAARKVGGFDETLPIAQDLDFLLRISMRWHVAVVEDVLMLMHKEDGYISVAQRPNAMTHLVNYLKSHIRRFNRELSERPKTYARVLRNLAFLEMRRGNRRASARAYWEAFKLDPFGSLKATCKSIGPILELIRERIRRDRS